MGWEEVNTMTLRLQFVLLAQKEDANVAQLCKTFNISRKTGYKWIKRFNTLGEPGLVDLSTKPVYSPLKTSDCIVDAVVSIRQTHPAWGGRKIRARLEKLGHSNVPAASTITGILHSKQLINLDESIKHTKFISFEHPHPNDLWQMDFKGHFVMEQGRCHPLTVLDDHSRYNVLLKACSNETGITVKTALIDCFRSYGLPLRMTMDNGSPWGNDAFSELTTFNAWLIRLGIKVSHSRPYHPQTQGKDERFHRTLKLELIKNNHFKDISDCQNKFDTFRETYNKERPHESLGMETPITRFKASERLYPETLPAIEYCSSDIVRKVQIKGEIYFKGKEFRISKALHGYPVALRYTNVEGEYQVFFCQQKVTEINTNIDKSVTYLPEQV